MQSGVYNNGHSHQTTNIRQLIVVVVVVAIAVCVCSGLVVVVVVVVAVANRHTYFPQQEGWPFYKARLKPTPKPT